MSASTAAPSADVPSAGTGIGATDRRDATTPDQTPAHPTFAEAFRVWLKIGLLSFGGPAGQIALMHRILVDEKRWIGEARFLHALNYCMLLPGPEAQQLATYVGWLLHKVRGGLVAGTLFVLPGFFAILGLSILYAGWNSVPLVAALFYGLKPVVLAIVIQAVQRVGSRALKTPVMWGIAALAFICIYLLDVPFPLIVLGAGLIGLVGGGLAPSAFVSVAHGGKDDGNVLGEATPEHLRPSFGRAVGTVVIWGGLWAAPVLALWVFAGPANVFTQCAIYFSKMAVVTFGGAYAVLAYVAQAAVETYGWISPGQMLDGLALAETTPGPLILVLEYVGFLAAHGQPGSLNPFLAGTLAATLVVWVTFTPCFLWIFLGGPYIEALRGVRLLDTALSSITAAVVGVILNLAIWFAVNTLFGKVQKLAAGPLSLDMPVWSTFDPFFAVVAIVALVALLRFKTNLFIVLGAGAVAGIVWRLVIS
jgi:chromate transporter